MRHYMYLIPCFDTLYCWISLWNLLSTSKQKWATVFAFLLMPSATSSNMLFYGKDAFPQSHVISLKNPGLQYGVVLMSFGENLWMLTKQNLFFLSMTYGPCMQFWWILKSYPGKLMQNLFFQDTVPSIHQRMVGASLSHGLKL